MSGRMVLVLRLLLRDLRRRRTETMLLVVAIGAAAAALTVGRAFGAAAADPYEQTRAATAGPDVVALARDTGPEGLRDLAPLSKAAGVVGSAGPFPVVFVNLVANGRNVHVVVEGRDPAPTTVDQPKITSGSWLSRRGDGIVVERAFADALGVTTGDTVSVTGHRFRVDGIAVTAAYQPYPSAGWRVGETEMTDSGGLIWMPRAEVAAVSAGKPVWYTQKVRITDRHATVAFTHALGLNADWKHWDFIASEDNRKINEDAILVVTVGGWLLTGLSVAGVAGLVAGRIAGQRRRVGLLKAVGAGPGMIAGVHLAEYLVIALAGAGLGLTAGWLAAPALTDPGAGLLGTTAVRPPPLPTIGAAVALALAIAGIATLAPVVRAATTSTVHALAGAAAGPRRRRWHIGLSRRLPAALLLGVRINARRPRRARLVVVNTALTTTMLVSVVTILSQGDDGTLHHVGATAMPDPRGERMLQTLVVIGALLCGLALLNAVVHTWTAVIDARQPLAVARALGATPVQAGAGLAVAQVLPAVTGVAVGVCGGLVLVTALGGEDMRYAPVTSVLAVALGTVLVVAVLTAVPAVLASRRPVAEAW